MIAFQEWLLKEEERVRLEKEIEEMEAARLRMKEERRLAQAKAEEDERLRRNVFDKFVLLFFLDCCYLI